MAVVLVAGKTIEKKKMNIKMMMMTMKNVEMVAELMVEREEKRQKRWEVWEE